LLDVLTKRTSLGVLAYILVRILRRVAYGRRHDELVDGLATAAMQLRPVAPDSVLPSVRGR
jgi:hypothetical protein